MPPWDTACDTDAERDASTRRGARFFSQSYKRNRKSHLALPGRRSPIYRVLPRFLTWSTMANVLVVDDTPDVADSFAEVLSLCGHDVRIAYNGTQALNELELSLPDVALVDLNMPVLDGFELARRIRDRWGSRIRLIAHTASARAAVAKKVTEAGFDSFVPKTARPLDLALAIHARGNAWELRRGGRDRRHSRRSSSAQRRSSDRIENGSSSTRTVLHA